MVRNIFHMYVDGFGLAQIAKTPNEKRVPAPQPPRTRVMQAWCPSSIREKLRNEPYRGVQVWNRTEKVRNLETGHKVSKDRPREQWMRVNVPEWRIVSEDLWKAAHARIAANLRFGAKRLGGLNRRKEAIHACLAGYLCVGHAAPVSSSSAARENGGMCDMAVRAHRYRGVCSNVLTIRQDLLESQLLAALEQRILNSRLIDYTLQRFQEELQKRLAEIQRQARTRRPPP